MEEYVDASQVSLSYFDVCPSEFYLSSDNQNITHAGVHFFMIYKPGLKIIPQFKNSRGLKNKFQWIDYLIENIENKKIGFYCGAVNTTKKIGASNGINLLLKENLILKKDLNNIDNKIQVYGCEISLKNLIALSTYAISIIIMSSKFAIISKVEKKNQFAFIMDLLPTDSAISSKNMTILTNLIFSTHLWGYLRDDMKNKELKKIGFIYGHEGGSTQAIKKWHEYVITDWIVHCVNQSISDNSKNKYLEFVTFMKEKKLLNVIDSPLIRL